MATGHNTRKVGKVGKPVSNLDRDSKSDAVWKWTTGFEQGPPVFSFFCCKSPSGTQDDMDKILFSYWLLEGGHVSSSLYCIHVCSDWPLRGQRIPCPPVL